MKEFNFVLFVSIFASLMHLTAFIIYNSKLLKEESKPNIISWGIWGCLAVLNAFSYSSMSQNWIVSLLSITGSVMCMFTFIFSLFKGEFSKPSTIDWFALFFGLFSVIIWMLFDSSMYANFIVLFGVSVGFVPTYKSVFSNPKNEPPLPWLFWSIAFFLGFIAVLADNGELRNYVYPVSMLILHFGVFAKSQGKKSIFK